MKKIYYTIILLLWFTDTFSQNCKPDAKIVDKITKAETIIWQTKIPEAFSLLVTAKSRSDEVYINYGKINNQAFLSITLLTTYSVKTDANFDTPYIAEKGKNIYLSFANEKPLVYTVEAVSNQKKVTNISGIFDTRINELNSYAQATMMLSDADLELLKKSISSDLVNFIRIELGNNVVFERDIKKTKGEFLKGKVLCFFDSKPSSVSDVSNKNTTISINTQKESKNVNDTDWSGKYKCDNGETLTLNTDNSYQAVSASNSITNGKWGVNENIFSLTKNQSAFTTRFSVEDFSENQFIIKSNSSKKLLTCTKEGAELSTESPKQLPSEVVKKNESYSISKSQVSGVNQSQPNQQNTNNKPISIADELLKFKQLVDAGLMTKEEFNVQKNKLLGIEETTNQASFTNTPKTDIKVGDAVKWQDSNKKVWEGRVFAIENDLASVNVLVGGKSATKKVKMDLLGKK